MEVLVRIPGVRRAELLRLANRFIAVLRGKNGDTILCHLPDTGRLASMMAGSAGAYYVEVPRLGRSTYCDVIALLDGDSLVFVDSRLPNIVFSRLAPMLFGDVDVTSGVIKEFMVKAPFIRYRADFVLVGSGREPLIVEVKGVNYSRKGVGLFPSAKSDRALTQLEALRILSEKSGVKSMLVFIALRGDITMVKPNSDVDPKFASRLCSYKRYIMYKGYRVRGELRGSTIYVYYDGEIPVVPCS